jgi:hypothetical protein
MMNLSLKGEVFLLAIFYGKKLMRKKIFLILSLS